MPEDINEKIEILKDTIGSREGYLETSRILKLNREEKEIFMRALLEVNKNKPNIGIILKAYHILDREKFLKMNIVAGTEPDEAIKNIDATPTDNNIHNFCISCGNKLDINANFCSKCGVSTNKATSHTNSNTSHKHEAKTINDGELNTVKPKPNISDYSNDRYKSTKDSSTNLKTKGKKTLLTIFLVLGIIIVFFIGINSLIENDPDTRIETFARQNSLSYSQTEAISDIWWKMNGEKGLSQKRENENDFFIMIAFLLLVGTITFRYIWRSPRKKPFFPKETKIGRVYNPLDGTSVEIYEGFCWHAFFFGIFWYFYKGMIGWGLIYMILLGVLISTGPVFIIFSLIIAIIFGYIGNNQYIAYLMKKGYMPKKKKKHLQA